MPVGLYPEPTARPVSCWGGDLMPFCWLHRCISSLELFGCEEH